MESAKMGYDEEESKTFSSEFTNSGYKPIYLYTHQKAAGDVRGLTLLDIGCGDGTYYRYYLEAGVSHVTAVEISPYQLEICKKLDEAYEWLKIEPACKLGAD